MDLDVLSDTQYHTIPRNSISIHKLHKHTLSYHTVLLQSFKGLSLGYQTIGIPPSEPPPAPLCEARRAMAATVDAITGTVDETALLAAHSQGCERM